ncbi:hypothetical protein KVH01_22315 [Pseudomonas sp. SWRI124]|nr:hypothetical protein [Pseudomonas khavaziana]
MLEKAVAETDGLGIKGETVKPFIQAQMDAAKAIQYRHTPGTPPRDQTLVAGIGDGENSFRMRWG